LGLAGVGRGAPTSTSVMLSCPPRSLAWDTRSSAADLSVLRVVTRVVDLEHVLVEGANRVKKHQRPNPMKNTTGGIVDKEMPLHISNVAIFNPVTQKADRVGVKLLDDGRRVRFYKSNGEVIDA